jgi:hypothetical protein
VKLVEIHSENLSQSHESFIPMRNFWSPATLQFPASPDLDRLKLYSDVKPENHSLLQELRRSILWSGRREPVIKMIEATLIKRCDITGAWSSDRIESWLHRWGQQGTEKSR